MNQPEFDNVYDFKIQGERLSAIPPTSRPPYLKSGPPDGTSGGMEERLAKLEAHVDHLRADTTEIRSSMQRVADKLGELPTKRDLTTNTLVMVTIGLAVLGITIGGIVGGLGWIQSIS